jgi:nitroreductase
MEMKRDIADILNLIKSRRTVFPPAYSDEKIAKSSIEAILEAATWAPNHGSTEPWHFVVFQDDARIELANILSEEYKVQNHAGSFIERKYQNLKNWPVKSPLIIAVCMKRGTNPKIPDFEEERAVSCAVQNMMLVAKSMAISSYWSSGNIIYGDAFKNYLNLGNEDKVIALLYFGYSKEADPQKERSPYTKFTEWRYEHKS